MIARARKWPRIFGGELRKISRCCFTRTRALSRDIYALRYIGWAATRRCTYPSSNYRGSSGWWTVHPADVISRNLSRGRTSFARSPARVAARLSFDGVNAHEKRTNCTAIEFHGGFLQGFHRRRSLPRDRKGGCLHSCDPGDYIVATRCSAADGKVKITDCIAKCIAMRPDETCCLDLVRIIVDFNLRRNNHSSGK